MRKLLANLFDTSSYTSLLERERATILYVLSGVAIVLMTLFAFFNRDELTRMYGQRTTINPEIVYPALIGYIAGIATWWSVRQKRLFQASLIMLVLIAVTVAAATVTDGFYLATDGLAVSLIVILGVVLLQYRGLAMGLGLALGITALGIANRAQIPPPTAHDHTTSMMNAVVLLAGMGSISYLLLRYAHISRTEGAQEISAERMRLAEITSQVAQRISHRMPLQDVLNNAVEQIHIEYPLIYHAQIFLVDDEGQNAQLVASTGQVGRMLIERRHSLPIGSLSVIGQVTANGQAVIFRAGSADGIHRRNEFLPDTAVEAAFPLRIGDQIIGALDLQSKVITAFQQEDLAIFQSLADHIAIAIDNARLFDETETRLQENRQLVEQTRRAAAEVERLNQQLTRRFWDDYLAQKSESRSVTVDFANSDSSPDSQWTPTLSQAVQTNAPVYYEQDGVRIVAVPLQVRGQVIGAMEFELDASGQLAPEDLSLIQEVGERLGLAAETNRLFEASQSAAQREALVNEIATRLQASNTVEMTLSAAARSLKDTMKASRVAIRLGTPQMSKNRVSQEEGS